MNLSKIPWKQWLRHDAGPVLQFIKYGIAGGAATLTHIVLFFLLGWRLLPCLTEDDVMVRLLGVAPTVPPEGRRALFAAIATTMAFLVSNGVAYTLNVLFVFKPGRHSRWVEIGLFYAVSAVSLVLGTAIQTVLIARYDLMTTLAFGANIFSALMINYAMRRFVIFKG